MTPPQMPPDDDFRKPDKEEEKKKREKERQERERQRRERERRGPRPGMVEDDDFR